VSHGKEVGTDLGTVENVFDDGMTILKDSFIAEENRTRRIKR